MPRALRQRLLAPAPGLVQLLARPEHRVRWWSQPLRIEAVAPQDPRWSHATAPDGTEGDLVESVGDNAPWYVSQRVSGDTIVRELALEPGGAAALRETITVTSSRDEACSDVRIQIEPCRPAERTLTDLARARARTWKRALPRLARYVEIVVHEQPDDLPAPGSGPGRSPVLVAAGVIVGVIAAAAALTWPLRSGGADDPAELAERFAASLAYDDPAGVERLYAHRYFDARTFQATRRLLGDDGCARPGQVAAVEEVVRVTLALYDDCEGDPSRDPLGHLVLPVAAEDGPALLGPGSERRWFVVGEAVIQLDDAGGNIGDGDIGA